MIPITCRTLATLALFVAACLTFAAAPAVKDVEAKKPASRLEALWADLASSEEAKASRALLALAASPKDAVALCKQRLKPVKVEAVRVKKLIEQLDDDEFDKREEAARELEYLGRFAKPHLDKALEGKPSAETRKRVDALLKRIPAEGKEKEEAPKLMGRNVSVSTRNGQIELIIDGKRLNLEALAKPVVVTPNAQWVRAARAVALLETVNSAEARALLKELAAGEGGATPTDEAKAALQRLDKQK